MKVEIVNDEGTEEINIDGNTILPYYINVLSITHHPDKIVFRMLGKYHTRVSTDYNRKTKKGNDKLWIMGKDKKPVTDGGEEEKIM